MAGTIIADFIRADANRISLNVGNTVIASINASGILSNTGSVIINQNGQIANTALFTGFKNGITEADSWRITTDVTFSGGTQGDLTANWERVDTDGFDKIGTGMSQSSGIFTFPSTGYWEIDMYALIYRFNANVRYGVFAASTTLNNSTYDSAIQLYGQMLGSTFGNSAYTSLCGKIIFKVTDVSLCKVKFYGVGSDTFSMAGATDVNYTGVTFKRIGDL